MWQDMGRPDKGDVLDSLEEMIDCIVHIQGKEYADCVMVLYNQYTMGIALIYGPPADVVDSIEDKDYAKKVLDASAVSRKQAIISLGFLFQTSATMLSRVICETRKAQNKPLILCEFDTVRKAMFTDFKSLATKMGIPNEII